MCCATTGLALSLLFYVASSLLPARWCRLARVRCRSLSLACQGPTGPRRRVEVARASCGAEPTARGTASTRGEAGMRHDTVSTRCTLPRNSSLLVKAKLGRVWERSEAAQQILWLCLREGGFTLSNQTAHTNG